MTVISIIDIIVVSILLYTRPKPKTFEQALGNYNYPYVAAMLRPFYMFCLIRQIRDNGMRFLYVIIDSI